MFMQNVLSNLPYICLYSRILVKMEYFKILSKDAKMKLLIEKIPQVNIQKINQQAPLREHLIRSIVSQQLSIKVAPIIFNRFKLIYNGKFPSNKKIIETDIEVLRSSGLSYQKSNYIKNIALFFEERKLKNAQFESMTDEIGRAHV